MSSSDFRQSLLEAIQSGRAWSPDPPPVLEPSDDLAPFLRQGQLAGAPWPYLPIEIMKSPAWHKHWSHTPHRFLSSGTSQAERSLSPFSSEGLNWYQAESMSWFWQNFRKNAPSASAPIPGISLIPSTHEWPDSSLAKMMAWIATYFACEQMTVAEFVRNDHLNRLSRSLSAFSPKWIFGTSIHWLQVISQDPDLGNKLPAGCVLVETGGTKGMHRSMGHGDFLELLGTAFPKQCLVSEYGMSELACQAYGRIQGRNCQLTFPPWVKIGVMTPGEQVQSFGKGALWVWDPYRVDLPFPIRTQDIVEIAENRSFKLLRRVPYATLKGCSLNVGDVTGEGQGRSYQSARAKIDSAKAIAPRQGLSACEPSRNATYTQGPIIANIMRGLLSDVRAVEALAEEIGLPYTMAQKQFADWLAEIPISENQWRQMARNAEIPAAINRQSVCGLFLPPKNHSLALLEPLSLALAAGHQVWLRIPDSVGMSDGPNSFLAAAAAKLMASIPTLKTLPSAVRISPCTTHKNADPEWDYLYVHGQTKTLSELKRHFSGEIYGFGDAWSLAVVTPDIAILESQTIIEHMLHLGQHGCQSLRALFIQSPKPSTLSKEAQAQIKARLASAFADAWGKEGLDLSWQLSLEHAGQSLPAPWKLSHGSHDLHQVGPLLPEANWDQFSQLGSIPLPIPYSLPIVWICDQQGWQRFASLMQSSPDFLYLYGSQTIFASLPSAPTRWEGRDLSQKRFKAWSGRHQGSPLFRRV